MTDRPSAGHEQLARWAGYPTRSLVLRSTVAAILGAAVHLLLRYLFLDRDAALTGALSAALWFGALVSACFAGTSLWARHQARPGWHVWWLADPDD